MKKRLFCLVFLVVAGCKLLPAQSFGQLPPFTKWYQNPLGFSPLKLHTSNAIILPAIAATACLLLTQKDTALARKISYFNDAGISYGYIPPYTSVYMNNTGILFHARRWMAIGAEFHAFHFRDNINNTWGIGLRPFVRWYPLNRERLRLFFESGAGIIYCFTEFPQPSGFFGDMRKGTFFNGTPKYGIGAEIKIEEKTALILGLRHVHLSNGNTFGADRNPGHDSNGFFIGLSYRP